MLSCTRERLGPIMDEAWQAKKSLSAGISNQTIDDAYTAAGSVVTEDVPAGALAVARSKQENIEGYAERRQRGLHSEKR